MIVMSAFTRTVPPTISYQLYYNTTMFPTVYYHARLSCYNVVIPLGFPLPSLCAQDCNPRSVNVNCVESATSRCNAVSVWCPTDDRFQLNKSNYLCQSPLPAKQETPTYLPKKEWKSASSMYWVCITCVQINDDCAMTVTSNCHLASILPEREQDSSCDVLLTVPCLSLVWVHVVWWAWSCPNLYYSTIWKMCTRMSHES
jgi:hypothetical protein